MTYVGCPFLTDIYIYMDSEQAEEIAKKAIHTGFLYLIKEEISRQMAKQSAKLQDEYEKQLQHVRTDIRNMREEMKALQDAASSSTSSAVELERLHSDLCRKIDDSFRTYSARAANQPERSKKRKSPNADTPTVVEDIESSRPKDPSVSNRTAATTNLDATRTAASSQVKSTGEDLQALTCPQCGPSGNQDEPKLDIHLRANEIADAQNNMRIAQMVSQQKEQWGAAERRSTINVCNSDCSGAKSSNLTSPVQGEFVDLTQEEHSSTSSEFLEKWHDMEMLPDPPHQDVSQDVRESLGTTRPNPQDDNISPPPHEQKASPPENKSLPSTSCGASSQKQLHESARSKKVGDCGKMTTTSSRNYPVSVAERVLAASHAARVSPYAKRPVPSDEALHGQISDPPQQHRPVTYERRSRDNSKRR